MKNKTFGIFKFSSIFILFIFGISGCEYFKKDGGEISHIQSISDIKSIERDTVYIETEIEVPFPIEIIKDTIIYREIPHAVDTASIISVYLQKKAILDTIKIENGYISVIDTISGNSLISRRFSPKLKPQFTERVIYEEKDPQSYFYIGINGGIDKPNYIYSLGTSLFYQTPNSGMYQIGIGVWNRTSDGINGEFFPYLTGGYYWRLNLKSKK